MRNLKYVLLGVLMLFALAIPLAMTFRQAVSGGIEGFILDENGSPVSRSTIQVFDILHGGSSAAYGQTNGFYRIGDLAAGRYSLLVEAKSFTSQWIPMVIVEEGRTTRKDIQLRQEVPAEESQSAAAH